MYPSYKDYASFQTFLCAFLRFEFSQTAAGEACKIMRVSERDGHLRAVIIDSNTLHPLLTLEVIEDDWRCSVDIKSVYHQPYGETVFAFTEEVDFLENQLERFAFALGDWCQDHLNGFLQRVADRK